MTVDLHASTHRATGSDPITISIRSWGQPAGEQRYLDFGGQTGVDVLSTLRATEDAVSKRVVISLTDANGYFGLGITPETPVHVVGLVTIEDPTNGSNAMSGALQLKGGDPATANYRAGFAIGSYGLLGVVYNYTSLIHGLYSAVKFQLSARKFSFVVPGVVFPDPGPEGGGLYINEDGQVGIGTAEDDQAASAILELRSTTKALLLTRLTTAERDAMTAVNGEVIYNRTVEELQAYVNGEWATLVRTPDSSPSNSPSTSPSGSPSSSPSSSPSAS